MHTAVFMKDLQMAEFLLKHGASVHISMEKYLEHAESRKEWWIRHYRDDPKKKLCYYGQDVVQPLELAVRERDIAMVRLVLEYGASVDSAPHSFYSTHWDWAQYTSYSSLLMIGAKHSHS
jgi:ankyrin repeat protein